MIKRTMLFFIALLLISGQGYAEDKLNVFVSILPQAFFAEKIGGEKVDVSVMIPPGGNPHTYEPTPSQLTKLSQSDVYIKVGSGVEFELEWMKKLISLNKKMYVCDSSKGIQLIGMPEQHHGEAAEDHEKGDVHPDHAGEHHPAEEGHHSDRHGGKDPHIWLAPSNAILMVSNIKEAFIQRDPVNKEYYVQNAANLVMELDGLRSEIAEQLKDIPQRTFLIFHPAWGYFAADFNLNQVAAENCGKEPSPKELLRLIKEAQELNVKLIFASPQFSRKSAQVIANEIDGEVTSIDPLARDYLNNLRKVAQMIKTANEK